MSDPMRLFVFGDQTFDVQKHLEELFLPEDNTILKVFLHQCYEKLRRQLHDLPADNRRGVPRFSNIEDVIRWKQRGGSFVPLDMALTCLFQLGTIMNGPRVYECLSGQNTRLLGLCTGSLAAAALSCSTDITQLALLGVEAVSIAFKLGLLVLRARMQIDGPGNGPPSEPWSIFVAGRNSSQVVATFLEHDEERTPTSCMYVSAALPGSVTVSGPPSSLARLRSSELFKGCQLRSIPIFAPYHAPHIFFSSDIAELLLDIPTHLASYRARVPLLSSSAGVLSTAPDFASRTREALADILTKPISWPNIIEGLHSWLAPPDLNSMPVEPTVLDVQPIASTTRQMVYTALKDVCKAPSASDIQATQTPECDESRHGSSTTPKLAIIAMSGRFPGAEDIDAFWDLLHKGLDVHKEVPPSHWDVATHVDPTGKAKNTSATPFGCWLDDPEGFDARFFSISPKEAEQTDPAQRLALMTAYEAIESAGLVPDATPSTRRDRVGVFYGVTSNDWMETNSAQNIDAQMIPGGNRAFIPGRINYCFKFSGPSYAVDTACSSSLAAIHMACNAIWQRDIDTAIAGGTNILTNPDFTAGLDRGHFLSRTGNCKTFDDSADGYCRGEGVGTVIIKRLDDAIADKDPILGVILGAYTNHSAESVSITRPHVGAQQDIFEKILSQTRVDPSDVTYIEMHGTGTQQGDAGEMTSVLSTFAPPTDATQHRRRDIDHRLHLGSAKANIGHGEAASGVSSLIKVLLMMRQNTIPPHCGIKTKINHKFPTDLEQRNVAIALKPTPWTRLHDRQPRRAFINNFSAAGGNTAILIEDAPLIQEAKHEAGSGDSRGLHLVAVSAKSGVALQSNMRKLLDHLRKRGDDIALNCLSYTTTARRIHYNHRVMFASSSLSGLCSQIDGAIEQKAGMTRPKGSPNIVFTFTGNGAQYLGMAHALHATHPKFRKSLDRLNALGQQLGFPSVMPIIESKWQDLDDYGTTAVQVTTVILQMSLFKLFTSWNITPTAVVGHSLGEFAALNAAGVLSDADTIYLVGKRALLMEERCTRNTHAMLVINTDIANITDELALSDCEVACVNSPSESVVSGSRESIANFQLVLDKAGYKSKLLKVPYAFHSSQVDSILDDLTKVARGLTIRKPNIPVLCPMKGEIMDMRTPLEPQYFAEQCRRPVQMLMALCSAYRDGILTDQSVALELGPHPAVSGMIRACFPAVTTLATLQRGRTDWNVIAASMKTMYEKGVSHANWAKYHEGFPTAQKVISLPAYSWDLKPYWIQYVNDWSLRKGDPPLLAASPTVKLESTTIHRLVEEVEASGHVRIVVEADIARKDLSPLVQGHEVDGVPLCTPSVYCDIALSLGKYVLRKFRPQQQKTSVSVDDMTVSKALILNSEGKQQLLQAHVDANLASEEATIRFCSFDSKQKLQEHSRCVVRYKDNAVAERLSSEAPARKQAMQQLRDEVIAERAVRFNRAMVYRMIRPLARFHDDYRAIQEIVLNSDTLQASSKLHFGSINRDGDFNTHPAVIDALTQSCGFAMNCNDYTDLDKDVFMNHGWGAFQIFQPLDFETEYTTYTQMHEGKDNIWHGDVVVFDDEKVVACFEQIAIQKVPRRVLKAVLMIESGAKSQKARNTEPQSRQPTTSPNKTSSMASDHNGPSRSPDATGSQAKLNIDRALSILAEESGIARAEFNDSANLSEMGIDSLMSLTISARFKEELDIDVDFQTSYFDHPTVGHLKRLIGAECGSSVGPDDAKEETATETDSESDSADGTNSHSTAMSSEITPWSTSELDFEKIMKVIAEESGVALSELTDDTELADAGIDSLLSLVISSRLRDELDMDIDHDSFFVECRTVADMKLKLGYEEAAADKPEGPTPELTSQQDPNAARRRSVETLVEKYTANFELPPANPQARNRSTGHVVLVTGGTGSLGSHVVEHLSRLEEVAEVICINRKHATDPVARQYKAMREKGIRFPEELKPKVRIFQADTALPLLGLAADEYAQLETSITHIIHNAWPMNAKKPLPYFEPQFQVLRNLLDLAARASSHCAEGQAIGFQMVSSIGVVGNYGGGRDRVTVPETRVDIDATLPNGYGEAKWGCERMLEETLHKYPGRFRVMAVRLGQIAGSRRSGYWNPMEHFGFLVKSSQTLRSLPDLQGGLFWTPVEEIAGTLSDLILADNQPYPVYHIENPVGQSWDDMKRVLQETLCIPSENVVPFEDWMARVRNAPLRNNPAAMLLDFLDDTFLRMSCGGLVLDTKQSVEHSKTLASVGPVEERVMRKYIHIWKEIGFLEASQEDREGFDEERARLWGPR